MLSEQPAQMARADTKACGHTLYAITIEHAGIDKPHCAVHGRSWRPFPGRRGEWSRLGPTSKTRSIPSRLRGCCRMEEFDISCLGGPHGANGSAIDAGRTHSGKETSVIGGVPGDTGEFTFRDVQHVSARGRSPIPASLFDAPELIRARQKNKGGTACGRCEEPSPILLRLDGRLDRVPRRRVFVGRRILRSIGLSADAPRRSRLGDIDNRDGYHGTFFLQCRPDHAITGSASAIRRGGRHAGRYRTLDIGRSGLGKCSAAMGALRGGAGKWGRMGRDQRGSDKRDGRTLVRERQAEGPRPRLQRREHWGISLHALMGRAHRPVRFFGCRCCHWFDGGVVLWPVTTRWRRLNSPDIQRQATTPTTGRAALLRDQRFVAISGAFALGLFAQVGLITHLVTRLAPEFGPTGAAGAIALTTLCAVAGRTMLGWTIGDGDRRIAASLNFVVQACGTVLLMLPRRSACTPVRLHPVWSWRWEPHVASSAHCPAGVCRWRRRHGRGAVSAIIHWAVAFAPAILGALRDIGGDYTLPFGIAACVQVAASFIVLTKRVR